jgi:hypothetical protein
MMLRGKLLAGALFAGVLFGPQSQEQAQGGGYAEQPIGWYWQYEQQRQAYLAQSTEQIESVPAIDLDVEPVSYSIPFRVSYEPVRYEPISIAARQPLVMPVDLASKREEEDMIWLFLQFMM